MRKSKSMNDSHLRHVVTPCCRVLGALLCTCVFLSAPPPLFADTPSPLLEVRSALTSYYGNKFEGKKTATGQRYDSEALTAAHRSLPFGTVVRITNLANGRDAIVRVNDRGPMSKRLMLDISRAAARELNMIRAGVVKVHMETVGDPHGKPVLPGTGFFLDLGTVTTQAQGEAEVAEVRAAVGSKLPGSLALRVVSEAMPDGKKRLFVGAGPFSSFTKAEKAFISLKRQWPRTRVVCAKTQFNDTSRLVTAIPADDLPDVVQNYRGKSEENKKRTPSKKKKQSRTSTAQKHVDKPAKILRGDKSLPTKQTAKTSATTSRTLASSSR